MIQVGRSVLVIEPDIQWGKAITYHLIDAGYDALIARTADDALHRLYQTCPDAVLLSNRLPAIEIEHLRDVINVISDWPLIKLDDDFSIVLIGQPMNGSLQTSQFVEILHSIHRKI